MSEKHNKILFHPDKEEIISKILNGESVKGIEAWLKKTHPKKKRLWVSYATLQKFRKEQMNLDGQVLDDIKAARKEKENNSITKEAKAIVASSSAYQKKINEIASNELDANRKLVEMMALVGARIEYYFNLINSDDPNIKSGIKEDKMFMELINTQKGMFQDYKKFIDLAPDHRVEHNINITMVNEQITVLKNIVFEVLQGLNPELIPVFIERVNSRLLDTQFGSPRYDDYQVNNYRQLDIIDAE